MPAPAPSWKTVPVFGTYKKLDGTAHSGSLRFTVAQRVVSNTDDLIFPAGSTFDVALDVDGHASVNLPCVDDPDNSPSDWSIKVEEKLDAGGGLTYYVQPLVSMDPTGLNLRTVTIPPPTTPAPAMLKGVPGGVAGLDSDGDVVDASGAKVVGGTGGTGGPVDWTDVQGKPDFADVAFTGDYNDLANKPTQPTLADVATSGDYNDLTNTPTLSTVAGTGDFEDLTNKAIETVIYDTSWPTRPDARLVIWSDPTGSAPDPVGLVAGDCVLRPT